MKTQSEKMEITRANFKDIVPKEEQVLLSALFEDLDYVNKHSNADLFIDWQNFHNEYSCERTDPCPDYYGYYTLRPIHSPYESVGDEMTLKDLDSALFLLCGYVGSQHYDEINKEEA